MPVLDPLLRSPTSVVPIDVTKYAWGRRLLDPNAPRINNPDGSFSTHRMAAEVDGGGNWWAFPTIVQLPNGNLHQFDDHQEAMQYNIQRGEAVHFGPDKSSALAFADGGYKQGTPIEQKSDLIPQP